MQGSPISSGRLDYSSMHDRYADYARHQPNAGTEVMQRAANEERRETSGSVRYDGVQGTLLDSVSIRQGRSPWQGWSADRAR